MEKRTYNSSLEVRDTDQGGRKIEGYASVFFDGTAGTEYQLSSRITERIMPTAFDEAIRSNETVALFNHDPNYVLGRQPNTLTLSVDQRGLRYSIQPPETDYARNLLELIKRGDVRGSSFGFQPVKVNYVQEGSRTIREVIRVKLFDVSPVLFPAYQGTNAELRQIEDEAEKILRERINKYSYRNRYVEITQRS